METTKELLIGQMVKSKAGRDKNRFFLVLDIIDENFVLLVDGDLRKIDSPKMKKVKHIAKVNKYCSNLSIEFNNGRSITDEWIRREMINWDNDNCTNYQEVKI